MVDSVITWGDIHRKEAVSVVTKPKIGGILVDDKITDKDKWVLIPFVGTDPDATNNVWRYSMDKQTCIIDEENKEWGHNKGALHATQYHQTSVKEKTTARTN